MTNVFISPIQLRFDCDWDRINNVYNRLIEMQLQGKFQSYNVEEYRATIYTLGQLGGSLLASDNLTRPNTWYIWNGSFLEKLLPPEFLTIKQQLMDAGFNFMNFSYTKHYGPVTAHVDGKTAGEGNNGHCNINYIISNTDPNAVTVSTDGKILESYPSIPGSCWLIDSASSHQVKNTGYREVFQLKIHNSFSEVKKFFESQGLVN